MSQPLEQPSELEVGRRLEFVAHYSSHQALPWAQQCGVAPSLHVDIPAFSRLLVGQVESKAPSV